jgi:hypothetical protein
VRVIRVDDVRGEQIDDVVGHVGVPDASVAELDGLEERVVQENVLLLGLHQEVALRANVPEEAVDVDLSLGRDLLQHGVQHNIGASSAHTGAAVHDDGTGVQRVGRRRLLDEAQHWQWVVGGAVVWPVGVVILFHQPLNLHSLLLFQLEIEKNLISYKKINKILLTIGFQFTTNDKQIRESWLIFLPSNA